MLKRLKKLDNKGVVVPRPSASCSHGLNRNLVGGIAPISLKFRKQQLELDAKVGRDGGVETKAKELCRSRDVFQLNLTENMKEEAPPIELGPKRLKVRGPSFPNSVVEQDRSSSNSSRTLDCKVQSGGQLF